MSLRVPVINKEPRQVHILSQVFFTDNTAVNLARITSTKALPAYG